MDLHCKWQSYNVSNNPRQLPLKATDGTCVCDAASNTCGTLWSQINATYTCKWKYWEQNKCALCKQIQRIENEVLQEKGILRTKINNTIVLTWLLLWESSSAAAATAVAGEKSLRNAQWGMQETHLVHPSLRASAKLYSSVFAGLLKEESSQTRTLKGKRTTVKNTWATRKSVAWKAQTDTIRVCQPRNWETEFSIRGVAPHKYADKSTTKPF